MLETIVSTEFSRDSRKRAEEASLPRGFERAAIIQLRAAHAGSASLYWSYSMSIISSSPSLSSIAVAAFVAVRAEGGIAERSTAAPASATRFSLWFAVGAGNSSREEFSVTTGVVVVFFFLIFAGITTAGEGASPRERLLRRAAAISKAPAAAAPLVLLSLVAGFDRLETGAAALGLASIAAWSLSPSFFSTAFAPPPPPPPPALVFLLLLAPIFFSLAGFLPRILACSRLLFVFSAERMISSSTKSSARGESGTDGGVKLPIAAAISAASLIASSRCSRLTFFPEGVFCTVTEGEGKEGIEAAAARGFGPLFVFFLRTFCRAGTAPALAASVFAVF